MTEDLRKNINEVTQSVVTSIGPWLDTVSAEGMEKHREFPRELREKIRTEYERAFADLPRENLIKLLAETISAQAMQVIMKQAGITPQMLEFFELLAKLTQE